MRWKNPTTAWLADGASPWSIMLSSWLSWFTKSSVERKKEGNWTEKKEEDEKGPRRKRRTTMTTKKRWWWGGLRVG